MTTGVSSTYLYLSNPRLYGDGDGETIRSACPPSAQQSRIAPMAARCVWAWLASAPALIRIRIRIRICTSAPPNANASRCQLASTTRPARVLQLQSWMPSLFVGGPWA